MKVYTKTGDQGQTSLLSKQRVYKDHVRVEAYGTVDEASAAMGLAKSLFNESWAVDIVQQIQEELISLNADLATEVLQEKDCRITGNHVTRLESVIDFFGTKTNSATVFYRCRRLPSERGSGSVTHHGFAALNVAS